MGDPSDHDGDPGDHDGDPGDHDGDPGDHDGDPGDHDAPILVITMTRNPQGWPDAPGIGWPSWAFENHDAPRAISRWFAPGDRDAFARLKMLLLLSLRGNAFLYYGEELGLTQVEIGFEHLRDPEAIANWPLTLSRDGARTPMPWRADAPQLGFTAGRPWLPIGPDHAALAVDRQEADPDSLLNLTRRLIALRHSSAALMAGSMTIREAGAALLVFERAAPGQTLHCAFNLSASAVPLPPHFRGRRVVQAINGASTEMLPPYAALIAE
jgi:alpha-glucosidase